MTLLTVASIRQMPPQHQGDFTGTAVLPNVTPTFTYSLPGGGTTHAPANATDLNTLTTGGVLSGQTLKQGDVVQLTAGVDYTPTSGTKQTVWPNLTGTSPIYVVTTGTLPSRGTRITSANSLSCAWFSHQADGVYPVIFANGAHNYVFSGIYTFSNRVTFISTSNLMSVGPSNPTLTSQLADDITFSQCGWDTVVGSSLQRCITLNCKQFQFWDCYIRCGPQTGLEQQAVAGWNHQGPGVFDNCFFQATSENTLFGGADPSIANIPPPADITWRRCYFYKDLKWNPTDPSYTGPYPKSGGGTSNYTIKNCFELKVGRRILVEDCLFENYWLANQNYALAIKTNNQNGNYPLANTTDVTFRHCFVKNVWGFFAANAMDLSGQAAAPHLHVRAIPTARLNFLNVLVTGCGTSLLRGVGGSGPNAMTWSSIEDLQLKHVTCLQDTTFGGGVTGTLVCNTYTSAQTAPAGETGSVPYYREVLSARLLVKDCIFKKSTSYGFKAVAPFTSQAEGNASLAVDCPGYTIRGCTLIGMTASAYSTAENNFPASSASIGFVNLVGQTAGDLRIASNSTFKGSATDGTDPGANVDLINWRTRGCSGGTW